jgi:hypothetical protein
MQCFRSGIYLSIWQENTKSGISSNTHNLTPKSPLEDSKNFKLSLIWINSFYIGTSSSFKNMSTHIKQKNCPCRKSEYCTNGLKCIERNCFLLKSSTVVTRSLAIPIENLNPRLSILASDYRQSQSLYSFKY